MFSFDLVKSNSGNVLVEARSASNALVASGTYSIGGSISLSINGSGFTGNVLTLIVKQIGSPPNSNAFITIDNAKLVQQGITYASHYEADLLQASDYYAFGSLQPSRVWYSSSSKYRFGFNGMERDDEAKGNGNSYTTLHRIYDSRLGRWLSVDPEAGEYPDEAPYVAMENDPISETDPNGDCPWCIAALKGAVQEYATQVATNLIQGKGLSDALTQVDVMEIGKAAVIDGLTMGLGSLAKKATTVVTIAKATDKAADAKKVAQTTKKVVSTTGSAGGKIEKNLVKTAEKKLPGGCFVKGTLILTSKGLEPIEQIAKGDTVWAYSDSIHNKAKQAVYKVIVRKTDQLITFKIGKSQIVTTPEHPFYINQRWIEAVDVKQGDSVVLFNGKKVVISSKIVKDTVCTVYNFAVENYHTYYVSKLNVLVHNNCGQPPPGTRKQALNEAKKEHGVPKSASPDKVYKPGTKEGAEMGLDKRNKRMYEYTNKDGKKVYIREDKPASYPDGGKQGPHFNAGSTSNPSKSPNGTHHYYTPKK